jgi:hypothetical protein
MVSEGHLEMQERAGHFWKLKLPECFKLLSGSPRLEDNPANKLGTLPKRAAPSASSESQISCDPKGRCPHSVFVEVALKLP